MVITRESAAFKNMEELARDELSSGESLGECVGLAMSDCQAEYKDKIENELEVYDWLCDNIR